jgi:hemerythrin
MPIMEWSNDLSVGIIELDSQHKRLINLINDLHEAMSNGSGRAVLSPVLNGLVQYTATHFQAEEKYMKQFQYPAYAAHKAEHDSLTKKVLDFKHRFDSGQAMLTVELMTFLKSWLRSHILENDKKYGEVFKQQGLK